MRQLTERQAEILKVIRTFVAERGYFPTLRELGPLIGITSTNGTIDHLKRLEAKGYLARAKGARTTVLVGACVSPAPETDLLRRWVELAERSPALEGVAELVEATRSLLAEEGR